MYWSELGKDQNMAKVKETLIETIESLEKSPVTEAELKSAKTALLNELENTISDPQRLSVSMSESIALGDWRLFFIQRDRIEALTLADVARAAKNYFKEDNRSFGQYIPVVAPDRSVIPDVPDIAKLVDGYKGRAAVVAGEAFDASPANIDKRTEKSTLANGAKLALLSKKTCSETVVGRVTLLLGDEKSMFGQLTNNDLITDMLVRGSSKFTRAELSTKLGELKARLRISQSGQQVFVDFDTVRSNLSSLLDVLREVLRAPSFPQSEFDLLIKENVARLGAARNKPQTVAAEALNMKKNSLYKKGDVRYQETTNEEIATYSAAKLVAVKNFYQNFYGTTDAEVVLVGDFDASEVKAKLAHVIGDWKTPKAYVRVPRLTLKAAGSAQNLETPDKANVFYLANLPFALNDQAADYPALILANKVLGGGMKSRLFGRLRQKDGISYSAGSGLSVPALDNNGSLTLYAIYVPQNLVKLQVGVQEEVALLLKDGVSATELADAKQALAQERTIRLTQDHYVMASIANQVHLGRGMDFEASLDAKIAAATLEQVNAAIRKYIKPEEISHFYAGDFAGAAKKTAKDSAK